MTSSSSGNVGPPPPGPTVEPSGTRQVQETFKQQQTILEELRSQEQAAMAALLKINSADLPAMERARNIFLTHMTAVEKQKEQVASAEKIYRSAAEADLRYAAGQKHPVIVEPPSAPTATATNVGINTGGSSSAFRVQARSTPRPEELATVACTLYA
jgi:hypothetical protein